MAGKEMELLVKLGAKLEQSYPAAVRKAMEDANKLQAEISKLNSIKAKADNFEALGKQAKAMAEQFNVAKANAAGLGAELGAQQALVAKYKTQIDTAKAALSGMSKSADNPAYKAAKANIAQLTAAMAKAKAEMKETKNQYKVAAAQAEKLGASYSGHTAKLRELETELENAGFSVQNFANSYSILETRLSGTNASLDRNKKVISDFQNQQALMQKAKNNVAEKQQRLYNAFGNFESAKGVAESIVSPFVEATKEAMKFESAMADVKKVVDFDTPEQFKEMKNDILNLSKVLPMTTEEISAIVAAGGQSGIARNDLLSFAESAAKMGIAFDITADQAGDMMAKWRTAFKMSQPEVVALADKVNYLGNTTAAAAPLISDVLTRIGPLGEVGGLASGELAAMSATMIAAGEQSDVAATGLKNMMLAMVAGESATKSQKAALSDLKLDAVDLAKRMQTDASGAVIDLMKRLQGLDKYEQASVLQNIFGKESIGPISKLLNNLPMLEENLRKVGDASQYSGSMEAEYAARSATTENKLKLLENTSAALSKSIGDNFLPVVASAAEKLADLGNKGAVWIEENQTAVQWIGLLAGGLAGMAVLVTGVALAFAAWQFVTAQLALMKTAIMGMRAAQMLWAVATGAVTAAQWLLNAAMTANPIGLVIAAIAALIAIGYLLISNWDTVKAWFVQLWNDPKAAIDTFVSFLKDKIGGAVDWVIERWNTLKSALAHPLDAAVNFITTGSVVGGEVKANAEGGIYKRGAFLTTFAEDSAEAAIPLDGTQRAISLWRKAGEMLGVMPQIPAPAMEPMTDLPIPMRSMGRAGEMLEGMPQIPAPVIETMKDLPISMDSMGRAAEIAAPPTAVQLEAAPVALEPFSGDGDVSIEINMPSITINGNADAGTVSQLEDTMARLKADLMREMERQLPAMMARNAHYGRRTSYA